MSLLQQKAQQLKNKLLGNISKPNKYTDQEDLVGNEVPVAKGRSRDYKKNYI